MTEDEANQRLSSAMDHLHAFAATFTRTNWSMRKAGSPQTI